ncbi:MAG: hypothetical protein IJ479_04130 [Alphaproteobacteria bacterium]|nr:hypothetical protein [Alphaproteobacteria bacterium]
MRSNLLALKQTSSQMDIVQNRLSTGLEVNSAIDNPSSYYTAQSLTNRAGDLDALLNSMGQAVQTVKAATEGIEAASAMVEQMRSVTEQTLTEAGYIPHKVEVELKDNVDSLRAQGYTVVTSQTSFDDFKALVAQDNAKIVLGEDVDFKGKVFNITGKNVTINGAGHTLSVNQIQNNDANATGAVIENIRLRGTDTGSTWGRVILSYKDITIRNVEVSQSQTAKTGQLNVFELHGGGKVENVKINVSGQTDQICGIYAYGNTEISGVSFNLNGKDDSLLVGVFSHSSPNVTVSNLAMQATGGKAYGVLGEVKGVETHAVGGKAGRPSALFDGEANTKAIVDSLGKDGSAANAAFQFYPPEVAKGDADFGAGTWYLPSIGELMEMYGFDFDKMTSMWDSTTGANRTNLNAINKTLTALGGEVIGNKYYWSSTEDSNTGSWHLSMGSGVRLDYGKFSGHYVRCFQLLENCFSPFNSSAGASGAGGVSGGGAAPKIGDVMYSDKTWSSSDNIDPGKKAVGVVVGVGNDGSVKIVNLKDLRFNSATATDNFNPANPYSGASETTRWSTGKNMYKDVEGVENFADLEALLALNPNIQAVNVDELNLTFAQVDADKYEQRYNEIVAQYDGVIRDSSYKGVNLLNGDKLKVNFNEDRSSSLSVSGKDMTSEGIGLSLADWAEKEGIMKSVQELTRAVSALRSFSEELGTNYSIITTRQDFTENLINVLEEGADKLTLADMNEEGANMLALQTRQQLAVNSLSLASQSSQSILKMF